MRSLLVLVVMLGAVSGYPREQLGNTQGEIANQSFNAIDLGNSVVNRNDTGRIHHFIKYNETNENFAKLIELLVQLSEADCFRDDGFPRSKRGTWEDAMTKLEETYHKMANKVKETATKVKDKFHEAFVNSGFKEKVKEFFKKVAQEFNIDNMCRNVQKLSNVLRRYPIDDKISTLVSFLDIILCQMSKDSETGFRELTENPKYERLISEKDTTAELQKLMEYIKGLNNIDDPEVPKDLLASSGEIILAKSTLIFVFGSVIVLSNVVQNCKMFL